MNKKQQLMAKIRTAWEKIPTAFIEDLCATIPGRLIEILKMKSNLTKYEGKIGIY